MTLEVEDGTAKADAESFASVAETDAYLGSRGYTLWANMLTAEKEQALRRATDYMQQIYHNRWHGSRYTTEQALDWPRYAVPQRSALEWTHYATSDIPAAVKRACMELAFRGASGPLAPDISRRAVRETVGEISVEYEQGPATVRYRAIDAMLAPLMLSSTMGIPLVRA